jgi:hypothetical protein
MEHTLKFVVSTSGRPPAELYKLLTIVYSALSVRKPLFGGSPGMLSADKETVDLFVPVLADDEEELVAAASAVMSAFQNFGIETQGRPEVRSSREVRPTRVRTAGVQYEESRQELTIDTWAPDWADLEISLVPKDGQIVALLADYEHGSRKEQAMMVRTIRVRRPAGMPPSTQPLLPES